MTDPRPRFLDVGPPVEILDGPAWLVDAAESTERGEETASALWAFHLAGKHDQKSHGGGGGHSLTDPKAFNYTDGQTGLTVKMGEVRGGGEGRTTYIGGYIRNRDGEIVGTAEHAIMADGKNARLDGLALEPGAQGQGFGTRYMAQVEGHYRDNGVTALHLTANVDVGGYSWARAGFDFESPSDRIEVGRRAREVGRKFNIDVQREIARVANNPHSSPADFAMIGHRRGLSIWPGKQIMLGSLWSGVMQL